MTGTAETEARRVLRDLQARRGGDPDQPAGPPRSTTTTSSTAPSARSTTPSSTRSSSCTPERPAGAGRHRLGRGQRDCCRRMLKRRGIPHNVLNAKYHQQEAEIVAQAGPAGRGHHRHQHGRPRHRHQARAHGRRRRALGRASHIIGTERHEARRIDRQLRGRVGPPGRPGLVALLPVARGRPDAPVRLRAHRRASWSAWACRRARSSSTRW